MNPEKDINSLKMKIGSRFKEMRDSLKLSQRQLAEELKILPATLSQIENGKVFPSYESICLLVINYRLNACWLIAGEGDIFLTVIDTLSSIRENRRLDEEKYINLLSEMRDPRIESLIFSRLVELKILLGIAAPNNISESAR